MEQGGGGGGIGSRKMVRGREDLWWDTLAPKGQAPWSPPLPPLYIVKKIQTKTTKRAFFFFLKGKNKYLLWIFWSIQMWNQKKKGGFHMFSLISHKGFSPPIHPTWQPRRNLRQGLFVGLEYSMWEFFSYLMISSSFLFGSLWVFFSPLVTSFSFLMICKWWRVENVEWGTFWSHLPCFSFGLLMGSSGVWEVSPLHRMPKSITHAPWIVTRNQNRCFNEPICGG